MDHFRNIYTLKASQYHQMIDAEDVDNNLLAALTDITTLKNKRVLDLGSGTGRLPILLRNQAEQIIGLDFHIAMLQEQVIQRKKVHGMWPLLQGDMHNLPFPSQWADVVLAGWALGHFVRWYPEDWPLRVKHVISEMQRTVKPQRVIIIMETLGTGSLQPAPPHEGLAQYYSLLEDDLGFEKRVISTDYRFNNVGEAIDKSAFFFGQELVEKIRTNQWARVPEWTGIWSRHCD